MVTKLSQDPDHDVSEAAELADYELLKHKKNKLKNPNEDDSERITFQQNLAIRGAKEDEERKKKEEEEIEEDKYDISTLLKEARKSKKSAKSTQ